jgi:hypothetical protein
VCVLRLQIKLLITDEAQRVENWDGQRNRTTLDPGVSGWIAVQGNSLPSLPPLCMAPVMARRILEELGYARDISHDVINSL